METGHPSTRAINSGSGNRAPVNTVVETRKLAHDNECFVYTYNSSRNSVSMARNYVDEIRRSVSAMQEHRQTCLLCKIHLPLKVPVKYRQYIIISDGRMIGASNSQSVVVSTLSCSTLMGVLFTHTCLCCVALVGCVAQWLERRSLTGELSLASAQSAADM